MFFKPWVSVICTCYNHADYIKASIESVMAQDYELIELIVIDNRSTDLSGEQISALQQKYPQLKVVLNDTNVGLCRAFNQGVAMAKGDFLIDLAADDILLPQRISKQVAAFMQLSEEYAVVFTNAEYVDAAQSHVGYHYASAATVPTGDVFAEVLKHYFICTPTIMMRKSSFMTLGGYDESLAYEDFDFFVRSSRVFKYHYLDQVLTAKRLLPGALSTQFYCPQNDLLRSSAVICQKAMDLCQSSQERYWLAHRIESFIDKCFVANDAAQARSFLRQLWLLKKPKMRTKLLVWLTQLKLPVYWFYQYFNQYRNQKVVKNMQKGQPFIKLA